MQTKTRTKNQAFELLTEILKSIDLIGIDGTLVNIKRNTNPFSDDTKTSIEFILGKTCIYFKVSQKNLVFGNGRGERVNARDACIWMLRMMMDLSYADIDEIFLERLGNSCISRSINRINNLDKKMKVDRMLHDRIKLIQHDFTTHTGKELKKEVEFSK